MAVSDDSINPPPPPVALKDDWSTNSLLHVEAKNSNSLILVRDSDRRIIGADVGTFKRYSPIGVCYIEARVAGNQLYTHVINDPSRQTSLLLQDITTHSAVPEYDELRNELQIEWPPQKVKVGAGGLLILLSPWEPEDLASLWSTEVDCELLLELFPSPNRLDYPPQDAIPYNQRNAQEHKSSHEPNNIRSFSWHNLKPGTYEVEFPLPPLGKRRIPVLIESGYMTLICAHQIAGGPNLSQGVICLWPLNNLSSKTKSLAEEANISQAQYGTGQNKTQSQEIERLLTSARKTEVALDALYIKQIGVDSDEKANLAQGEFDEPIRALATGYAWLLPFVAWFDAYSRGEHDASSLLPKDARETLNNVITLGKALFKQLPHSVDARLLAVAGLWFLKSLETQLDHLTPIEKFKNVQKDSLNFGTRKREQAYWLFALAAITGIATLISLNHTFHLRNATGNGSALRSSILITIMCSVITAAFYYVASRPAKDFTNPPMFSVGMDILLRLSALSKEVCLADSRITDIALRLTTDSLWTRWNSQNSPLRARNRFEQTLSALTAELDMNGEVSSKIKDGETVEALTKAANRVALALRYPLSFITTKLERLKPVELQRIAGLPEHNFANFVKHIKAAIAEASAGQQERTQISDPGLPMIFHLFMKIFRLIKNFRLTKNFTLIELLAVMTIISILAAILFPVFGQAREKSRQTSCLSNLKQLGTSLQMYLQDYDENLPLPILPQPGSKAEERSHWKNAIYPYLKNEQGFICPSDTNISSEQGVRKPSRLSYMYNRRLQGLPLTYSEAVKIKSRNEGASLENARITVRKQSTLDNPAETVMIYEASGASLDFTGQVSSMGQDRGLIYGVGDSVGADAIIPNGQALWKDGEQSAIAQTFRHNERGNFAFVDGHTKSFSEGSSVFKTSGENGDPQRKELVLPDDLTNSGKQ